MVMMIGLHPDLWFGLGLTRWPYERYFVFATELRTCQPKDQPYWRPTCPGNYHGWTCFGTMFFDKPVRSWPVVLQIFCAIFALVGTLLRRWDGWWLSWECQNPIGSRRTSDDISRGCSRDHQTVVSAVSA